MLKLQIYKPLSKKILLKRINLKKKLDKQKELWMQLQDLLILYQMKENVGQLIPN